MEKFFFYNFLGIGKFVCFVFGSGLRGKKNEDLRHCGWFEGKKVLCSGLLVAHGGEIMAQKFNMPL